MRRLRLTAGFIALLFGVSGTRHVQGQSLMVEIHYPPPRTIVESPYLAVEGVLRTWGVEQFNVTVNDGRPDRVKVQDGLFSEQVRLDGGMNVISVGGVMREVYRISPGNTTPPADFSRVYGHFGLSDGCLECHTFGPGGRFVLAGEREKICLWCHEDLLRGRGGKAWTSVHAPVSEGKCLRCHGAHISSRPGLPAEKPPLCADCHAEVYGRLKTDNFVHGPMSLGDCRLCHTAHASAEPGLLVRPATELCTDCHSEALPPPDTPADRQPHVMIPEGRCARCHFPHSSPNHALLTQPPGRLCMECHPTKTRSFHEKEGFSIYICAKCHILHRPTQPHLIKDASRSLCLECHNFRDNLGFTHSFVKEGRCFLCHTFHESSLPGEVAVSCLGCHRDNPGLPAAHRGVPFERSNCTDCHLPHQSRRPKLLQAVEHTPFARRECDRCHLDRSGKTQAVSQLLCLDCHKKLDLSRIDPPPENVHPPFRDKDCNFCHCNHSSEELNLLVDTPTRHCLGCHRKLKKSTILAPKSAHEAFLEGRCGVCHNPHFSGNAARQVRPSEELCLGCHAAVAQNAEGLPWKAPHAPIAEGKCGICHRPHTSILPSLQVTVMPQQCRPCHEEIFSELEASSAGSLHRPVKEEGCGYCHPVHGSDYDGLLSGSVTEHLCTGCHWNLKDKHHQLIPAQLKAAPGGEGAGARGCLHCHMPHASKNKRLLPPPASPVCAGCHKK